MIFKAISIIRLLRRNRLPSLLFLGALLATLGAWQYTLHLDEVQAEHRFDNIAQDYQQKLRSRFVTYLRALVDLRGLFDSNPSVNRGEFAAFMQSTNLVHDFPGITHIGYAPLVHKGDSAMFEARAQKEGLTNYRVKADQKKAGAYFPILYAYPPAAQIQSVLVGLDVIELPSRRRAMEIARDTNQPAVTQKVALPSDPEHAPAISIYLPIYRYGAPYGTLKERRSNLAGFVFEAFKVEDLLRGVLGQDFTNNIDLKIYDGTRLTPAALLYASNGMSKDSGAKDILHVNNIASISVANNTWTLVFSSKPGFYPANRTLTPLAILIGGLLATLLLTGIAVQMNVRRRLAWAKEEQNQHFHSLFDQNPYAVFSLDLFGCFTSVNDASVKLAGRSAEELLGMHFGQLLDPKSADKALFLFKEAKNGTPQNGEVTIIHPSGRPIALNVTSLPIIVRGKITGVFGIAKDVTEQALAEAENRRIQHLLDTIVNNIPVMLFVKEAKELSFVIWNKAGEELTGFSREIVIGHTDCDLFDQKDAAYFRNTDRLVLETNNFLNVEEPIPTSSGVRWLHTKKVPFSMGAAQYLLGVSEDITEKKHAEEALRESEARFRAIFEQAPVGINQLSLHGEWLLANQKLLDIVGYSLEELKTKHVLYDITHPEDRERNLAYERQVIAGELDSYAIEKRYIRKDGAIVWVHVTRTTVKSADGKLQFLMGIVEDITARKQAETRIRKQQQLLSTIIDTLPLNLFIRDRQEQFILINHYAATTLGISKDVATGKSLGDVFQEPVLSRIREHDALVWKVQQPSYIEERIHQLGKEKYVMAGKLPLHLEGEPPLLLGYSIDITERKQAEDALQRAHDELEDKVRERTEELNNAYQTLRNLSSHMQIAREEERTRIAREVHDEMGGVLTAIKIDISMLKQRQEANGQAVVPELDRTLQLVDTAVTSLRRIITDLRPSILDTLGLQAALEWQLQEFQKRTNILCSFQIKGDEYELDDGRATAIFRIFQEALTNVAKHAQATRLDVFGKVTENEIVIKIKDNGIGIAKERRMNSKSFGILGMQERARIFNGVVQIASLPFKGTRVSIRFPSKREAD